MEGKALDDIVVYRDACRKALRTLEFGHTLPHKCVGLGNDSLEDFPPFHKNKCKSLEYYSCVLGTQGTSKIHPLDSLEQVQIFNNIL